MTVVDKTLATAAVLDVCRKGPVRPPQLGHTGAAPSRRDEQANFLYLIVYS